MSSSPPGEVIVQDVGAVRLIALHRPETKNGLTLPVNAALITALEEARQSPTVRAVLLTGRGGNFCSGLDLRAAMALVQDGGGLQATEERLQRYFHGLIRAVRALDQPVLAFIDGAAAGFGCDLALACDLRVGTARARFAEVFIKRGLMPDGGGTHTLPRLLGVGRALELMLLGDVVDAAAAERIGLLNRIVADEAEALALAQRLAEAPPLSVRHIKRAVYAGLSGSLDDSLALEARGQVELLGSQDFVEGIAAFFEKRPPRFVGK